MGYSPWGHKGSDTTEATNRRMTGVMSGEKTKVKMILFLFTESNQNLPDRMFYVWNVYH